jgi:hypothetical protein
MIASLARHPAWLRAVGEHHTVILIPQVADQLRWLQKRTDMSPTDLTNRAITSYTFLEEQIQAGNELFVRNRRTGLTRPIRFI